jgi:hypothetical protein
LPIADRQANTADQAHGDNDSRSHAQRQEYPAMPERLR